MSKTPYELRYELLAMAQSILSENLMSERIRLENDWNNRCDNLKRGAPVGAKIDFPPFPQMPAMEISKITEMADTLNKFVSKND